MRMLRTSRRASRPAPSAMIARERVEAHLAAAGRRVPEPRRVLAHVGPEAAGEARLRTVAQSPRALGRDVHAVPVVVGALDLAGCDVGELQRALEQPARRPPRGRQLQEGDDLLKGREPLTFRNERRWPTGAGCP
jgi:hypothetical protein